VSNDGTAWGQPIAQGRGETPTTVITFRPVAAQFIRITQTGSSPALWGIQQIRVYESPGARR
jgi:beta-glucosidase